MNWAFAAKPFYTPDPMGNQMAHQIAAASGE
jgi:hypothetical protein